MMKQTSQHILKSAMVALALSSSVPMMPAQAAKPINPSRFLAAMALGVGALGGTLLGGSIWWHKNGTQKTKESCDKVIDALVQSEEQRTILKAMTEKEVQKNTWRTVLATLGVKAGVDVSLYAVILGYFAYVMKSIEPMLAERRL